MAKETSSRAKSGMGGKKSSKSKKSGKHPHEIHIRRGKSGGFIVRHSFKPDADIGQMPEDEEHVMPDVDSLQNHVGEAMGDQPDQETQPSPEPEAAPAQGAAPAAPPQGM